MQTETGVDISGVGMQEATMQCYLKKIFGTLFCFYWGGWAGVGVGVGPWAVY